MLGSSSFHVASNNGFELARTVSAQRRLEFIPHSAFPTPPVGTNAPQPPPQDADYHYQCGHILMARFMRGDLQADPRPSALEAAPRPVGRPLREPRRHARSSARSLEEAEARIAAIAANRAAKRPRVEGDRVEGTSPPTPRAQSPAYEEIAPEDLFNPAAADEAEPPPADIAAPAASSAQARVGPRPVPVVMDISTRQTRMYAVGAQVEVWSKSQGWCRGRIHEIADTPQRSVSGVSLPSGSVNIYFGTSMKWILPNQRETHLRFY
jgi:hypothetical protein